MKSKILQNSDNFSEVQKYLDFYIEDYWIYLRGGRLIFTWELLMPLPTPQKK